MSEIWKFQLEPERKQRVEMPRNATILSVGKDTFNNLCVWAIVEPGILKEDRLFQVIGTGQKLEPTMARRVFIGTTAIDPFVWHTFELK